MPGYWFLRCLLVCAVVGCGQRPGSPDTAGADAKAAGPADSAAAGAKPSGAAASGDLLTAQDVLEKMAAAYKNAASYEDRGTVEFRREPTRAERHAGQLLRGAAAAQQAAHRVLQRQGVCDGKQWFACCDSMPGQVVLREAPPKLNMNLLRADDLLYSALQRFRTSAVAATPIAAGTIIRSRAC